MLSAKDYPAGASVYSYVDEATGETIHVDSERLRVWCKENCDTLEVFDTPVTEANAQRILDDGAVDKEHLKRVFEMPRFDPVIYGKLGTVAPNGGPDIMLIDGHHRYVIAAIADLETIPGYVLEREQWEAFRIEGLPDFTAEFLRQLPAKGGKGR